MDLTTLVMMTLLSQVTNTTDNRTDNHTEVSANTTLPEETPGERPGGGLTNFHVHLLTSSENVMMYMSPIMISIGTLGNTLSIIIMRSSFFRNVPSSLMMIMLALMDTGNLVTGLMRHWINWTFGIDIRALTQGGCKVHFFATYLFGCMCGWTLALLTVERTISVMFPLRAREICSRRNMKIALLAIFVILVLANSHLLVLGELVTLSTGSGEEYHRCDIHADHKVLMYKVLYWQDMLLSSAIPSGIIFLGNILITYRLITAQIRRQKITNADDKNKSRMGSTTVMLFVISFMFLICTLPITIFFFQQGVWFDLDTIDGQVKATFSYVIVNMLYYGNNTINFWLYFLSGRKFRKAFTAIFCPCRTQQAPTTTASTLSGATSATTTLATRGTTKF